MAGSVFIEGQIGSSDGVRGAVQKLMRDLEDEAAKHGETVTGDITISQFTHPLLNAPCLRLDAATLPR